MGHDVKGLHALDCQEIYIVAPKPGAVNPDTGELGDHLHLEMIRFNTDLQERRLPNVHAGFRLECSINGEKSLESWGTISFSFGQFEC